MENIIVKPIGYIQSPFKTIEEIPPQSTYAKDKKAVINLKPEYEQGLKDLDKFSHIIIQFHFHKSHGFELLTLTPWSDERKGVFATRSPKRPNPIGITIAKLNRIDGCNIEIQGVDMLDGTPVIDIKPYVDKLNP